ncbi:unnamed protein product [Bursaphelenchus xylophilus]|uniref:(pine wood nematode) hypothetical protein n=1 Tax=Bursaphelenchus xylophilus TaxID=6326 RepID=A0A1I7SHX2_BURXY|nr:unnamed protein product [Bursaphelenchus xylophilus]CAG9117192.1 unnamed protein product [Bursaphelenchus xylophilus]
MIQRFLLWLLCIYFFIYQLSAAECNSSQMCPLGWSVLRRPDGSAHTCDPTNPTRSKCPNGHTCVAAKCGIKFCCINDKMARKIAERKEQEEVEEDEL